MRKFPTTISITDIHHGKGARSKKIYASLVDSRNRNLLISGTLDYIQEQLSKGKIVTIDEYDSIPYEKEW